MPLTAPAEGLAGSQGEQAFGVDLAALGERFAGGRLSARDLLTLLAVALAAAGTRSPTRRSQRVPCAPEWQKAV